MSEPELRELHRLLRPFDAQVEEILGNRNTALEAFVLRHWGLRRGQRVWVDDEEGSIISFEPAAQFMRVKVFIRSGVYRDVTIDQVHKALILG